jgi:hypothetical protein
MTSNVQARKESLCASAIARDEDLQMFNEVSEQHIGPIVKSQAFCLDWLTLKNSADMLFRNDGNHLHIYE